MRSFIETSALVILIALFGSCGTSQPDAWKCEGDDEYLLATSRDGESRAVLGCESDWSCEGHSYRLECTRMGDAWSCTCERDGFSAGGFSNADICDLAGTTPGPSMNVEDMDRQIRTRINEGCNWELPLDH